MSIIGIGNALSSLGLTGNTGTGASFTASRTVALGSLSGKTLTSRPDRFDLRRARFIARGEVGERDAGLSLLLGLAAPRLCRLGALRLGAGRLWAGGLTWD